VLTYYVRIKKLIEVELFFNYVLIRTIIFNMFFVLMFHVLRIFLIHMTIDPFNIVILYAFLFVFLSSMFAFFFMR
jgi:hypothetical protein